MVRLATAEQHKFYNEIMYPWQDDIFGLIKSKKFYLTGGTCLSRFYYRHRYSDDLDFFFDGIHFTKEEFEIEARSMIADIGKKYSYRIRIDADTFKQVFVQKDGNELKIDFVFEPIATIGTRKQHCGIYLDTLENIAGNKLSTIYNRKTAKDYIDLFYLLKDFQLNQVIEWANEKMVPLDYEGTILCLVDGIFQGEAFLIKSVDEQEFKEFINALINQLINHARTVQ